MYTISIASSNMLPDADSIEEYPTLAEVKQGAIDEIERALDSDDELKYQRWEVLSRVTRRQIIHSKGLTIGVLYRPNSPHDLGQAVTIHIGE